MASLACVAELLSPGWRTVNDEGHSVPWVWKKIPLSPPLSTCDASDSVHRRAGRRALTPTPLPAGEGLFYPRPVGEGGPEGRVRARTDGLKRAIGIICITRCKRERDVAPALRVGRGLKPMYNQLAIDRSAETRPPALGRCSTGTCWATGSMRWWQWPTGSRSGGRRSR